jgi:hypothetical protein
LPANPKTLQATEEYRRRVIGARKVLQDRAEAIWPTIEELETSDWAERMATTVAQAQVQAVRITSAYLGAVLTLETGQRTKPPTIDSDRYANLSRDGRPLVESFRSALVGVKVKLSEGYDYLEALKIALSDAVRLVGVEYDYAHRQSMLDAIAEDNRFVGWSRAVAGTCGACAAAADGTISEELHFEVHPGCQCVTEPEVKQPVQGKFVKNIRVDPTANSQNLSRLYKAMDEADDLVGSPYQLEQITVTRESGESLGLYESSKAAMIIAEDKAPELAYFHEFGHWLDLPRELMDFKVIDGKLTSQMIGPGLDERLALLRALKDTPEVRDLLKLAVEAEANAKSSASWEVVKERAFYMVDPREVIARLTCQYLAEEMPKYKPLFEKWSQSLNGGGLPERGVSGYWSPESFKKVKPLLEAYWRAKGYKVNKP